MFLLWLSGVLAGADRWVADVTDTYLWCARVNLARAERAEAEIERLRGTTGERLSVVLPLPPSTNRIWRNVGGRTLLSAAARDYLKESGWLIKEAATLIGWEAQPDQRYSVEIVLHFPDHRRADVSNRIKLLEDAAAAALGFDDSQVDELVIRRGSVDKEQPRAELTIMVLAEARAEGN